MVGRKKRKSDYFIGTMKIDGLDLTPEMKEPEISECFDLEDIRKIRAYNAARYEHMTPGNLLGDWRRLINE